MRIIPAIDLIDGQCVRLAQGDYQAKKVYDTDPLEVAKRFEAAGLQYLHLVDLDGAQAGSTVNWAVLEALASHTALKIDFGGGLSNTDAVRRALSAGAQQVTAGSIAVRSPRMVADWLAEFGPERILLGADVREGHIATHGWQATSDWPLYDFLDFYQKKGMPEAVVTDIARDGMLAGPATVLYGDLIAKQALGIIASGGIRSITDLEALRRVGCSGAIIGKALYEGPISLEDLSPWLC